MLPADGVGLARMEFIISALIRVHPMALVHPERVTDPQEAAQIRELTRGYADPRDYFVDALALGIAKIAAPYHPNPVIVRLSDFKTTSTRTWWVVQRSRRPRKTPCSVSAAPRAITTSGTGTASRSNAGH